MDTQLSKCCDPEISFYKAENPEMVCLWEDIDTACADFKNSVSKPNAKNAVLFLIEYN